MSDFNECQYLLKPHQITASAQSTRHPWNDNSTITIAPMSDATGIQSMGVHKVTIPPGGEAFVYHAHFYEEEWLYVLEGEGIALIEGEEYDVASGDFMGFPRKVAHHLKNPGNRPLTYLMGGNRLEVEIAEFPHHGKRGVRMGSWAEGNMEMEIYDLQDKQSM